MTTGIAQDQGRQRGAAMVEVALVVPLLLALVLGIAELGFRTTNTQHVVNATRSGTRVVSSIGNDRSADHDALLALSGALDKFEPGDVTKIIIFKPELDGSMPLGCRTAPQSGDCNHYDGTDLTAPASSFSGTTFVGGVETCSPAAIDEMWCPLSRNADQYPSADWIGVYVEVRHESVAPFLPDTTISDATVMRIEPRFD